MMNKTWQNTHTTRHVESHPKQITIKAPTVTRSLQQILHYHLHIHQHDCEQSPSTVTPLLSSPLSTTAPPTVTPPATATARRFFQAPPGTTNAGIHSPGLSPLDPCLQRSQPKLSQFTSPLQKSSHLLRSRFLIPYRMRFFNLHRSRLLLSGSGSWEGSRRSQCQSNQ